MTSLHWPAHKLTVGRTTTLSPTAVQLADETVDNGDQVDPPVLYVEFDSERGLDRHPGPGSQSVGQLTGSGPAPLCAHPRRAQGRYSTSRHRHRRRRYRASIQATAQLAKGEFEGERQQIPATLRPLFYSDNRHPSQSGPTHYDLEKLLLMRVQWLPVSSQRYTN